MTPFLLLSLLLGAELAIGAVFFLLDNRSER